MRSRWSCGLGVALLLAACTRPNTGFDGGGSESSGAGEADGGRTTGGAPTAGDGPATEGRTTTDGSADGASEPDDTSVADTSSTSSGQSDTGPACRLDFPPRYGIVSEPPLEEVVGACSGVETLYIQNQGLAGGMLTGALCAPSCTCEDLSISLTFEGPAPTLLPGCFELAVQLEERDGACTVTAYRMSPHMVEAPVFVASNVEMPMFFLPFAVALAEAPVEPCGNGCTPASGAYDLVASPGGTLPPDGTPVVVSTGVSDYRVVNDGSGIDPQCAPQVRWFAERD